MKPARVAGAAALVAFCAAAESDTGGRYTAITGALPSVSCPPRTPGDARCTTISVVENRSSSAGRRIPLAILILPATAANRATDPVFVLAGGPGQAASDLARVPEFAGAALRRTRDIVFVDQRGTGRSNGLNCPFYGPPDDPQSYFTGFLPPAKVRACRVRLQADADLTQYVTAYAVDDLDEVRRSLGFDRINLVGGSYGTRLAMEYVRTYEERVRTVILEGAVPPTLRAPEGFGEAAQRSLDAVLAECAASPGCAAAFPELRREARGVFERLKAGPVTATVAHPDAGRLGTVTLTRDHVGEAIRYMLYSSRWAGRVPLYLHEASQGRYEPIAQFLLNWRRDGTFDGLYLSITCAEDVPFVSAEAEARDADTFLGGYRVREQRAACAEWPRGAAPDWRGRPVHARVPVLIASGVLDPVTLPSYGDEVARTLPNSLHVRIPFGAHSSEGLVEGECLDDLKARFIERGTVEGLDTSCLSRITRPPFATIR